jgi:hypothetical protein
MDSSKEIEQLKRRLIGLWDIELTQTMPTGQKSNGTGILLAKETALGHAVFAELALSIQGSGPYEEAQFWWVNGRNKKIHLFCVTSLEEGRDQEGKWKNDNTLVLEGVAYRKEKKSPFPSPTPGSLPMNSMCYEWTKCRE